ncbi:MAG: serine/threonine protein kinase [Polyangiaceae bacterium]|nr:serine/threonine protein kinase [Polyangiaceae bacterium]
MTEAQPQVPVQIGEVLLGKYVVERVIGAGGMGVVVAVRHRELNELYAMKFMLPAALVNPQAVERFVREARAAAKLKSEHVASVTDVGRLETGSPYMVMEHLTGKDLEKILEESGPMNTVTAATYVMQACDAIAEAHDAGIVHRDLKPANLFLTKRPSGSPCVKVLDFGISKSVNPDEQGGGSMTRTTAIMGSPYYMSPEQMRSSKNVDARTDIWALGVILYQLTTGRVPFPGDTITEVCSGVLSEDMPAIVPVFPNVSPEFEAIVRHCLAKRPEQRFQNARELMAALATIAGANPGTSGLELPGVVRTMALNGPPIMTGVHAGPPAATQAGWGTTQPTPAKKSGGAGALLAVAAVLVLAIGGGGYFYYTKSMAAAATSAPANADTASAKTEEPAKDDPPKDAATSEATATADTAAPATTDSAPSESAPSESASSESAANAANAPTNDTPSKPGTKPAGGKPVTTAKAGSAPTSKPTAQPTAPATSRPGGHGIF